jgi:hypothetical protein
LHGWNKIVNLRRKKEVALGKDHRKMKNKTKQGVTTVTGIE